MPYRCQNRGRACCPDRRRDLLLAFDDGRAPRRTVPRLTLTAHTDHPGLQRHEATGDGRHLFEVLGGVDLRQAQRASVRVFSLDGPATQAGCRAGALVLGNYHNTGEARLAPETIHLDAARGLVELLVRLAGDGLPGRSVASQRRRELTAPLQRHAPRLLQSLP